MCNDCGCGMSKDDREKTQAEVKAEEMAKPGKSFKIPAQAFGVGAEKVKIKRADSLFGDE